MHYGNVLASRKCIIHCHCGWMCYRDSLANNVQMLYGGFFNGGMMHHKIVMTKGVLYLNVRTMHHRYGLASLKSNMKYIDGVDGLKGFNVGKMY